MIRWCLYWIKEAAFVKKMKKFITLLFSFLLLTHGLALAGTETPAPNSQPFVGDPNYILNLPLVIRDSPDPVILAVGDSITQGVGTSSGGPETAFPRLLELELEATYHRNFTSINAGMGGARTFNIPPVMGTLIDTYHPDLVLLMIGTNDFGDDAPDWWIDLNIRDAITIALNKGVRVIVASNPPVDPIIRQLQFNNIYDFVVNLQQYYLIATYFPIPLAEVFSAFYYNTPGWVYLLPDQLHPNDAGHAIIRDTFYNQIIPLLDQRGCFR